MDNVAAFIKRNLALVMKNKSNSRILVRDLSITNSNCPGIRYFDGEDLMGYFDGGITFERGNEIISYPLNTIIRIAFDKDSVEGVEDALYCKEK